MKNLYSNKMVIFSLILAYGDIKIHWNEKLHRPDARQIIWQVIT